MLMAGVSNKLRVMAVVDEAHKLCGDETVTALIKEVCQEIERATRKVLFRSPRGGIHLLFTNNRSRRSRMRWRRAIFCFRNRPNRALSPLRSDMRLASKG
jgi:hypothetical protein